MKVNFKILLVLFVILLSTKILVRAQCANDQLVGKWKLETDSLSIIEFTPDGSFKMIIDGEDQEELEGPITYRLLNQNDTCILIKKYKQRMVGDRDIIGYEERFIVKVECDYLPMFWYKTKEGITDHIDEYVIYKRAISNPQKCEYTKKTKYIIPKGLTGKLGVVYNKVEGIAPEFDSEGNRVIRFPKDGYVETQLKEDVFSAAYRNYEFLVDNGDGTYTKLPSVYKFDTFKEGLYPANTLFVVSFGFNPYPRDWINKEYSRSVNGNIELLIVGEYSQLKKYMFGMQ